MYLFKLGSLVQLSSFLAGRVYETRDQIRQLALSQRAKPSSFFQDHRPVHLAPYFSANSCKCFVFRAYERGFDSRKQRHVKISALEPHRASSVEP